MSLSAHALTPPWSAVSGKYFPVNSHGILAALLDHSQNTLRTLSVQLIQTLQCQHQSSQWQSPSQHYSHLSGWNTVSWLWICQMKPGNNKVIQPIYTPPPAAPPTNSLPISFRLLFPSTGEERRRGSVSRVWSRFIDTKHRDLIWHQS